jgi:hypothetical protein
MFLNVRLSLSVLVLTAVCLAMSSCGGDSDTTVANLSKAEFIQRADRICSETEKRQLALLSNLQEKEQTGSAKSSGKESELELVRSAGLPPVKQQLEELGQLPRPETGSKQVESYLRALADGVAAIEDDPSLLLSLNTNPLAAAEAQAAKAGFKVCRGA